MWWEKRWHHPELIIRGRTVTSLGDNPWLPSDDVLAFARLYLFLSFFGLGCLSYGMSVCRTNFFLCQELPSFIPFWKILVLLLVLFYFSLLVKKPKQTKKPQLSLFEIWKIMHTLPVVQEACYFFGVSSTKILFFPSTSPPLSPMYPPPLVNLNWGSILSLPWMGRKIISQKKRAYLLELCSSG